MFHLKMLFLLINFINRNIAATSFLSHLASRAMETTVAFWLQPHLAACHLFALRAQLHLSSSTVCSWACQPLLNLKSHLAAKASTLTLTNLIGLTLSVRTSVPKNTVLILVLKYIPFMLYLSELLVISYQQDNFGPFKPYVSNSLHKTWKKSWRLGRKSAVLQLNSYLNNPEKTNLKLHPKKSCSTSLSTQSSHFDCASFMEKSYIFLLRHLKINYLCLCRDGIQSAALHCDHRNEEV